MLGSQQLNLAQLEPLVRLLRVAQGTCNSERICLLHTRFRQHHQQTLALWHSTYSHPAPDATSSFLTHQLLSCLVPHASERLDDSSTLQKKCHQSHGTVSRALLYVCLMTQLPNPIILSYLLSTACRLSHCVQRDF